MNLLRVLPFATLSLAAVLVFSGCTAEAKKERALGKADTYFKAGEYEKARIEYFNVLRIDANNAVAIERLGQLWLERGAPLRALPFLAKSKSLQPTKAEISHKIARILLTVGKADEARKEATTLLERASGDAEALLLLTEAMTSRDEFKAAEEAARRQSTSNSVWYHLAMANLGRARGDVAAVKTALRRALVADPKSPEAHLAMAALHLREGKKPDAEKEMKAAADAAPLRSTTRIQYADFKAGTGALAEANTLLNEMVQKAPDYIPAWRSLARLALAEKKHDQALAHLKKAFEVDQANYECMLVRAQVWLAKGDTAKALADLEEAGKKFPGLAADKDILARIHLQKGDLPQAVTALEKSVGANRDNDQSALLLAELYLRTGKPNNTVALLRELLGKRPNLERAQLLLIDAMGALGKNEDVVKLLQDGVTKAPNDPKGYFLLGVVQSRAGQVAEARASHNKVIELAPDFFQAHVELVQLDVRERQFAAATKRVEALLAKTPDAPNAHLLMAMVFAAQGQWNSAETSLMRILELEPANVQAYGLLTQTFLARKNDPGILARLEKFMETRSTVPVAMILAGDVLMALGEFTKAKDNYEKILTVQPENITAINNLAYMYSERLNQPEQALTLARKARAVDALSPMVADTLGWILTKRKEYAEAEPLLKESAERLPKNPEIQYHYGVVCQLAGKPEAAREAFAKAAAATEMFPGKEQIPRRLAELDAGKPSSP